MNKEQEQDIIKKVVQGDTESFRLLVDYYGENVFALIYKMVGSREDAQELAQDVFVKVFFSLNKFKGESSFSTWLYRIAYNISISKIRKKERTQYRDDLEKVIRAVDPSEESILDKRFREEQYEMLEEAIRHLPPDERFLIVSFYEQDKSLKELVDISGLSLSNVKIKLFRIKKKLALTMNI